MDNSKQKNHKGKRGISQSFGKAVQSFAPSVPLLLCVILLLGFMKTFVAGEMIAALFTKDMLRDTFIGAGIDNLLAGNPITSYIIGGELLKEGFSLFAVTAFMVAWVTVGVVQFPAEAGILGKRFSIIRNILSFVFAVLVSLATVATWQVLQ